MKKIRVTVFSPAWWGTIIFMFVCIIGLALWSKTQSQQTILNLIKWVSVCELALLFIYKTSLRYASEFEYNVWNELPCYLCNLTIFVTFFATTLNNRYCMGYCVIVGAVGAALALLMPDPQLRDIKLISIQMAGFYGLHIMLIISCTAFMTTGIYRPEYSDVIPVMAITTLCIVTGHISNYFIRKYKFPEANYIFTYGPAGNAPLEIFWNKCPKPLVYLFPVIICYGVFFAIFTFIVHLF